jgi:bile acid:Na+ symporter, BASS family
MNNSLKVLDNIRLNFSQDGFFFLNVILALIMFGVALEIKPSNFKILISNPKSVITGFVAQHILVPAVTFLLVWVLKPTPSIALGMILVAACPGGNISNFLSLLAKGNVELSVTLTAISTIVAVFMTPFNFALYGSLYSETSHKLIPITIDAVEMVKTVLILLGIPLVLGMLFSWKFPKLALKLQRPMKIISLIVFAIFVFAALAANFSYFLRYIHLIFVIVLLQNGLAFLTGHFAGKLLKLPMNDVKTIGIESGIHNSGLALVLIFNPALFNGLGGMAFIAAWWGIWHIIAGLCLATYYSRKLKNSTQKI